MVSTDKVKGENFSLINRLPDDDTMEIILYGTAYGDVKASIFRIDKLEDILAHRMEENLQIIRAAWPRSGDIIDAELKDPTALILRDKPDYEVKCAVRRHNTIIAAGLWCDARRKKVKMYGRLVGAIEQGAHIRESKDQIELYKNAIVQLAKEPLEYETIRDAYE